MPRSSLTTGLAAAMSARVKDSKVALQNMSGNSALLGIDEGGSQESRRNLLEILRSSCIFLYSPNGERSACCFMVAICISGARSSV